MWTSIANSLHYHRPGNEAGQNKNDMMKTLNGISSETFQKVIAINRDTIRYCEAELAAQVLDGSPFLLVITEQGVDRIYGEWEQAGSAAKVKGYLGSYAVQDNLCGAFLYSAEGGAKVVAALLRTHAELNPRLMHRHDFTIDRLSLAKATVAQCEKYLAGQN